MANQVGLLVVVVVVTSYQLPAKSQDPEEKEVVETVVMDRMHLPRMRQCTQAVAVVVTQVMHHQVVVMVVRVLYL